MRPNIHRMPTEFARLAKTYDSYSKIVTFLVSVLAKMLRTGHQPHLEELAVKLDFSGWYVDRVRHVDPAMG